MTKQTIIRYLKHELGEQEVLLLLEWIEASDNNRRYFNSVVNLWAASSQDRGTAGAIPDFGELKQRLKKRKSAPKIFHLLQYAQKAAAVLFIPLTVAMLWLLLEQKQNHLPVQSEQPQITVYTPLGSRTEFTLPDGTKVWLNSGTKLSYPRYFSGEARQVNLEGEAYFDVTKNKNFPFIVTTPQQAKVLVKGTTFNLCAYASDNSAEVTLVTGAIDFVNGTSHRKISIKPRQSARYAVEQNDFTLKTNINTDIYTAWKDGVLAFENTPMRELVKRMERWYGVSIEVDNPRILEMSYTGRFKEEAIAQALELLKQTSGITYKIKGKKVFLYQ